MNPRPPFLLIPKRRRKVTPDGTSRPLRRYGLLGRKKGRRAGADTSTKRKRPYGPQIMEKNVKKNQTVRAKERQKYLLVRTHKVFPPPKGGRYNPWSVIPPKHN